MGKKRRNLQNKSPEELAKEAYGFGDDQLILEFDQAQNKLDQLPENTMPFFEYHKLRKIMEMRGIKSKVNKERGIFKTPRKVILWRSAAMVGIVGVVLFNVGMKASGTKFFEYKIKVIEDGKKSYTWVGENGLTVTSNLNSAYEEVKNKLGITVLQLSYLPEDVIYSGLRIDENHATIELLYNSNYIHFSQSKFIIDNVGSQVSDSEEYIEVENEWIGKTIIVKRNKLENNKYEYRAEFSIDGAYYELVGIMDENLFINIVRDINFYYI